MNKNLFLYVLSLFLLTSTLASSAALQIKDLPAASVAAATDQIPSDNASNQTRKLTLAQIKTYLEGAMGTAQFRLLLDDTTATEMRATIGAVIGTNVQAWDADLDAFALKTAPSGTVVGTTDSQVLTNKTLTAPTLTGTVLNTDTSATTTSNAVFENLSTASNTTKAASIDFYGRDTVNARKNSARIAAFPEDGNYVASYLSLQTRVGDVLTERFKIASDGRITALGNFTFSAGGQLNVNGAGIMSLTNGGATDFARLQLGGTTSSFPAIKRNSAALNFRLADDSADAAITAAAGAFSGAVTGTTFTPTSTSVPSNGFYLDSSGQTAISQNGRKQLLIKEDPDTFFPADGSDISTWAELGGHRTATGAADGSVILKANGTGIADGSYTWRITAVGPSGGVHMIANKYIVANFGGTTMADDHSTYINFQNADDGASPSISAQKTYVGDSSNVGLNFYTVGTPTNAFRYLTDNASVEIFQMRRTASGVNYPFTQGSATGNAATIGVDGTDTNAGLTVNSKGTKGVNIKGTGTNDDAATGYVGEYVSSSVSSGSAVSLTDDTPANMTSISLTAGDWQVCVNTYFGGNAATIVYDSRTSISTTSATLNTATDRLFVWGGYGFAVFGNGAPYTLFGCSRVSLSATTTVYAVAQSNFATNTANAYGSMWARRDR